MAKYDRSILVPYLQDVCAMEMACQKLENEVVWKEWDVQQGETDCKKAALKPERPVKQPVEMTALWAGVFPVALGLLLVFLGFYRIGAFIALFLGGGLEILVLEATLKVKCESEKNYQLEMQHYNQQMANIAAVQEQLPQWKQELAEQKKHLEMLQANLAEARRQREKAYNVNIIPQKYRNIYAAYYLYDYFSTSREDDLDKIIQTLLLDQIQESLQQVVSQMETVILNQRRQIALQEAANQQITDNHRQQMRRLAQLEANQERQLDYQEMIAVNTEVSNYFLLANYFQNL